MQQFDIGGSDVTNQVVVELPTKRRPHLDHADWVAFDSVLRNLATLGTLPTSTLTEGLYLFSGMTQGPLTAEQVLDQIEVSTTILRVKLNNDRASKSEL
ncbi:hypothetical protein FRUB_07986 [Fimbriiglobus ruber]|uniref:Uncharacterized protein n=1 Tax=Fimbriiglobus ruber TaxID=1908690 RepID=A0A225D378_9BACT|nr:hypothetical protein FRUB_07986 [Fimbriiglobus ruber]